MEWKESIGKFASGETLWIKDVAVGGTFYNSSRIKGDENNIWGITTTLPFYVPKIKTFTTIEEAKKALESFTKGWLKKAGFNYA